MSARILLVYYRAQLLNADPGNGGEFHRQLRRGFAALGISDMDLATAFGVSQVAVRDWRYGRSVPPEELRAEIYRWLAAAANKELRRVERE